MIRKVVQFSVPIVGSAELDINSMCREYEQSMRNVNEHLANGWKLFSTHAITHSLTSYLVYVLIKVEFEKGGEEKC